MCTNGAPDTYQIIRLATGRGGKNIVPRFHGFANQFVELQGHEATLFAMQSCIRRGRTGIYNPPPPTPPEKNYNAPCRNRESERVS